MTENAKISNQITEINQAIAENDAHIEKIIAELKGADFLDSCDKKELLLDLNKAGYLLASVKQGLVRKLAENQEELVRL